MVKLLINELRKMSAGDERYDAKYTVLAESVKHHIEEEESELFPKLEGKLDVEEIGTEMDTRKQELQRQPDRHSRARASNQKLEPEGGEGDRSPRRLINLGFEKAARAVLGPASAPSDLG